MSASRFVSDSDTSHICSIPRPSIVFEIGPRQGSSRFYSGCSLRFTLVARDVAHYDIVIRDSSMSAYRALAFKVLPILVDYIARLPHLETLRWIFRDFGAANDFVDSSYPDLQRMLSAGQEMKVGYASDSGEPSDWEPMTNILRRFAYVVSTCSFSRRLIL